MPHSPAVAVTATSTNSKLLHTYRPLPVSFVRGEGAWLYDRRGKRYLDGLCGIAVTGLGHAHPAVTEAVQEQLGKLIHSSNLYHIEAQEILAEKLTGITGMHGAFFCNSGAEANEAAIKLARLHGHKRGIQNPGIAVMSHAFHGRTLATLSATDKRQAQAGFEPLVDGFLRVPYGDIEALRQAATRQAQIVAVLTEPIQGEAGILLPPIGWLRELRELCDRQGWLLIADEVQTGNGRTGTWAACAHEEVLPDVMTTAKGLGNGVPIGACLARADSATLFTPGSHASTFGGNPLACAAAIAVLNTMAEQQLIERAATLGAVLQGELKNRLRGVEHVVDIRGRGLMIGIELAMACTELVDQALAQGLLINVAADKTVRLLPPLILSDGEAEQLLDILCPLIVACKP